MTSPSKTGLSARISRRGLIGSGMAAGLLAATAQPSGALPRHGGSLRLALSPAVAQMVLGYGTVFDCLTEVAADGSLRGELAESWNSGRGGRVWTFRLRSGASFHDGTPCDANAVRDELARTDLGAKRLRVLGADVLEITLAKPDPNLPLRLARSEYIVRSASGVGSGLYQPAHMSPERAVLSRVPQHWRDPTAGWFDRVEVLTLDDASARAEALAIGRVDVANALPSLMTARLKRNARLVVVAEPGGKLSTGYSMRLNHPAVQGNLGPLDSARIAERWWIG